MRAGDGDLLDRQAGGQVVHERAAGCAERGNAMTVQNRADGSRRPGRPQVAVIGAGLAGLPVGVVQPAQPSVSVSVSFTCVRRRSPAVAPAVFGQVADGGGRW